MVDVLHHVLEMLQHPDVLQVSAACLQVDEDAGEVALNESAFYDLLAQQSSLGAIAPYYQFALRTGEALEAAAAEAEDSTETAIGSAHPVATSDRAQVLYMNAVKFYEGALAAALATTAARRQPGDPEIPKQLAASSYFNLALCMKRARMFEESMPMYRSALREQRRLVARTPNQDPEFMRLTQEVGDMEASMVGSAARFRCEEARQVRDMPEPTSPLGWKERGNAFYKIKRYADAVVCFRRGERLMLPSLDTPPATPRDAALLSVLCSNEAAAHMACTNYSSARSAAERATEYDPSNAKAWYRLGKSCEECGLFDEALPALEKACSLMPANGAYKDSLEGLTKRKRATKVITEADAMGQTVRHDGVDSAIRVDRLIGQHGRPTACPPGTEARCIHDIAEFYFVTLRRMRAYGQLPPPREADDANAWSDEAKIVQAEIGLSANELKEQGLWHESPACRALMPFSDISLDHCDGGTRSYASLDDVSPQTDAIICFMRLFLSFPHMEHANIALNPIIDGERIQVSELLANLQILINIALSCLKLSNPCETNPKRLRFHIQPAKGGSPLHLCIVVICVMSVNMGSLGLVDAKTLRRWLDNMKAWHEVLCEDIPKMHPEMPRYIVDAYTTGVHGAVMHLTRASVVEMMMRPIPQDRKGSTNSKRRKLAEEICGELKRAIAILEREELGAKKGTLLGRMLAFAHIKLAFQYYETTKYAKSARHNAQAILYAPKGSAILGQAHTEWAAAIALSTRSVTAGELRKALDDAAVAYHEAVPVHGPDMFNATAQSQVLVERILAKVEGEPDDRIITQAEALEWGVYVKFFGKMGEKAEGTGGEAGPAPMESSGGGGGGDYDEEEEEELWNLSCVRIKEGQTQEDLEKAMEESVADGRGKEVRMSFFSPVVTEAEAASLKERMSSRMGECAAVSHPETGMHYLSANLAGVPVEARGDGGVCGLPETNFDHLLPAFAPRA